VVYGLSLCPTYLASGALMPQRLPLHCASSGGVGVYWGWGGALTTVKYYGSKLGKVHGEDTFGTPQPYNCKLGSNGVTGDRLATDRRLTLGGWQLMCGVTSDQLETGQRLTLGGWQLMYGVPGVQLATGRRLTLGGWQLMCGVTGDQLETGRRLTLGG